MTQHANRNEKPRRPALLCSLLIGLGGALGTLGLPGSALPNTRAEAAKDIHNLRTRAATIAHLASPSPRITIPVGWFLMGSPRKDHAPFAIEVPFDNSETPQRRIWLDAYAIDRDEVSLGNYLAGVLRKPRALPPDLAQLEELKELAEFARPLTGSGMPPDRILATWPAFNVSWAEADTYCRSIGKRLPTEAEWEKAARGTKGRLFPWGNAAPDARRAVFGQDTRDALPLMAPVAGVKGGRSPYGLYHMAGNVAEWVQDWSGIDYYVSMPDRNPPGPANGRYKVVRGGSWRSNPAMLRAATRGGAPPEQRAPTIGFRCAKSGV